MHARLSSLPVGPHFNWQELECPVGIHGFVLTSCPLAYLWLGLEFVKSLTRCLRGKTRYTWKAWGGELVSLG
jgi:hypothetical protein